MDEAIDRALAYLHATQDTDGGWSVYGNGRRQPGRGVKNPAVTALCVMAFLSAGHVPGEGRYGDTVEKGVRNILKIQKANGLLTTDYAGQQEMYQHGICTLMLAEVAGMTEGALAEEVRKKLEKAVALTLKGQRTKGDARGGWRYSWTAGDSDISVTGWQLMSLRAAKNLGCDVPPESIDRAVEFIQRCYDPREGGYRYLPGGPVTLPCTGTSILGLELCGKSHHRSAEALKAGAYILRHPLRYGDGFFFYGVYYCAQAMFQLGDNYWKAYRPKLHELLLGRQTAAGAWIGGGGDGQYGPNYCTAMAVLALTVEYRFLPIYQRGEEPAEK